MHTKDAKTWAEIISASFIFLDKIGNLPGNHRREFFYHLTEEASDVIFSNIGADLAIKVLQPIKDHDIANVILNMPDQIQISTLGLFKENRRMAILEKLGPRITVDIIKNITNHYLITDHDAAEFIKNMNGDDQACILRSIRKHRRIDVLKGFKPETKSCVVKNLINYQEKWKDQWDDGILDIYLIYHDFPKYYPDTMRTCKGCGGSYKQWDLVVTADCRIHSFHENCEQEDGVCIECDNC